jgi:hypothetical protein
MRLDLNKLIDTRMLIAANSGGGKSWFFRLLAEQCAGKVQIIILDPEGEFITLREKIDIAVIGEDGELPTEIKTAKLLARKLAEHQASAIIDLYGLKLNDRREYVNLFLDSLMSLGRKYWHPIIVFIDEAHIFAPEKGKLTSTDAIITLMSQGRKRGYAGILATQRLSKIHKDAIAEANNVFIGRTWLDNDQIRAGDLLGMRKVDRLKLRDISAGEFFAFGPAMTIQGVTKFKTGNVESTHPKAGERHKMKVPPASEAVLGVLSQMGDLPAQVQEEGDFIARIQGENIDLKRQIAQLKKESPQQITKNVTVEVPYLPKNNIGQIAQSLQAGLAALEDIPKKIKDEMSRIEAQPHKPKVAQQPVKNTKPLPVTNGDLPVGEHKTLTACAQYPNGLMRDQISILTGYKRSSRDTYINRLKKRGALEVRGRKVFSTELGYQLLGLGFEPLPTGQALLDYWMQKLPQGEKAILKVLVSVHPNEIERDYLTEATDYKRSSRDTYINRLKAKELIEIPAPGMVKASDNLVIELA